MCVIFVSRKVLDVNQSNNFVDLYGPHGGPNQQWEFERDGTIRSKTGKVLDVCEARTSSGTRIIAYPWHGRWNQVFKKVSV